MDLPVGTVALLFTDIESSMRLWSADSTSMAASLEEHDRVLLEQIESAGGYVFTRAGDSFSAAFASGRDAVAAAERCQRRLASVAWPGPELRVRMGLHMGEVQVRDGDYFGPTVNLAARVAHAGHGGQIVVTSALLADAGRVGPVRSLGSYRLRGLSELVELHQVGDGAFPALRADVDADDSIRFDEFDIDLSARRLRSRGQVVHLEPQALDVLLYLVSHRDRLISREELLDEVWGDQFVSASALTTRIKQVRQALGDDGRAQRYIRNERGRGYQFSGAVTAQEAGPPTDVGNPPTPRPGSPSPAASQSTGVFGRADDLRRVDDVVTSWPVTTVVGPGGVGKTTLVRMLVDKWRHEGRGALEVRLDLLRAESGLLPAITTALGLSVADDEQLVACAEWLSATDQVLVLDNCEHLLDPVRQVVSDLLEAAPSVRVLATSRQPLSLRSESVVRLQPLQVPSVEDVTDPSEWPCLELFAATASRAGGMSITTEAEWADVVELCRRLDGLPLAIELAASRMSTFGIRDLIGGLDERLDWFRSRHHDSEDRQRSLRSTVEWSFRFLDHDALQLVDALACFPAGLRLSDLRSLATQLELATSSDEIVANLIDASVLARVGQGEARYTMLETIRQYANERLSAEPARMETAHQLLVTHATAIAQAERDAWTGEVDPRTRSLARLRDEIPNLRAARRLMLDSQDFAAAVALAAGLCAFTEEACLAELWSWYETDSLGDMSGYDDDTNAAARLVEATAARNRGELDRCAEAAAEAAALTRDPWIRGRALHTGAMASLFMGQMDRASELWLASDEELGGCRGRLFAAMASGFGGDLDRAASHLRQCHLDDDSAVPIDLFANAHLVRGEVARVGATGDARREFEQAVAVAREHGLLYTLGMAQTSLVTITEADGDHDEAAAGYRELLELFLRSGTWTHVWTTLRNAARVLLTEAPATALLITCAAAHAPSAPALDEDAQAATDELEQAASAALGDLEADRIRRRAQIVPRADVVRQTVAALGG